MPVFPILIMLAAYLYAVHVLDNREDHRMRPATFVGLFWALSFHH